MKHTLAVISSVIVALLLVVHSASALVGPHSYTNTTTGDVFLGGDYIELGISKFGSFGTTSGQPLPSGFYGTTARTNVGMSTNPTGFGESPDLRMDYFLPGTPEERWVVGYKIDDSPFVGNNAFLRGVTDVADYTVTDNSSGDTLSATGVGTLNSTLEITQIISFERENKFFRNVVTLKNISGSSIDSVRYMRSFDPDNTRDQGGGHPTQNQIVNTHLAGDGKEVVMSDTSNNPSDPVFAINGSLSPILFYSSDTRARVSTFGFANADPYAAAAYDAQPAKGTSNAADAAITIAVDVGTLAPGASEDFVYYTSLDNRDFNEVLEDIEEDDAPPVVDDEDGVSSEIESASPNSGDANDDGIQDSEQPKVTSLLSPITNKYVTLASNTCTANSNVSIISDTSVTEPDNEYQYPFGLMNFTLTGCTVGATEAITKYYYEDYDNIDSLVLRKYNPDTGSYATIPGATISNTIIGGQKVIKVVYSVTDGGILDQDGTANGIIVDPAGLGLLPDSTVGAPNTGLPRESVALGYLLLLSSLIVAGLAFRYAKKEK